MFKNLVLISFISLPLASENLLDIYNEALDNDPQYKNMSSRVILNSVLKKLEVLSYNIINADITSTGI